jgi:hypothetical protein
MREIDLKGIYTCKECEWTGQPCDMKEPSFYYTKFAHDLVCPKCDMVMIDVWNQKVYAKKLRENTKP